MTTTAWRNQSRWRSPRPELEFIQTIWGQGYCVPVGEPSLRPVGRDVIEASAIVAEQP
jgi:hypothetical protein